MDWPLCLTEIGFVFSHRVSPDRVGDLSGLDGAAFLLVVVVLLLLVVIVFVVPDVVVPAKPLQESRV